MSRKHMVGSVDRRGQQNAVFATLMDLAKRFEACMMKPVFRRYAVLTCHSDA